MVILFLFPSLLDSVKSLIRLLNLYTPHNVAVTSELSHSIYYLLLKLRSQEFVMGVVFLLFA
jgi:hypothetical protein